MNVQLIFNLKSEMSNFFIPVLVLTWNFSLIQCKHVWSLSPLHLSCGINRVAPLKFATQSDSQLIVCKWRSWCWMYKASLPTSFFLPSFLSLSLSERNGSIFKHCVISHWIQLGSYVGLFRVMGILDFRVQTLRRRFEFPLCLENIKQNINTHFVSNI